MGHESMLADEGKFPTSNSYARGWSRLVLFGVRSSYSLLVAFALLRAGLIVNHKGEEINSKIKTSRERVLRGGE